MSTNFIQYFDNMIKLDKLNKLGAVRFRSKRLAINFSPLNKKYMATVMNAIVNCSHR